MFQASSDPLPAAAPITVNTIVRHVIRSLRRCHHPNLLTFNVYLREGGRLFFKVTFDKLTDRPTFRMMHFDEQKRVIVRDAVFSSDNTDFAWLLELLEAHRASTHVLPEVNVVPQIKRSWKHLVPVQQA
jgi:hypothetical protein